MFKIFIISLSVILAIIVGIAYTGGSETSPSAAIRKPITETVPTQPESSPMSYKKAADFAEHSENTATIKTSKGTIILKLFNDEAPLTTRNFVSLVKDGFYDGIKFHRVVPEFVIQGGDPYTKQAGKEALWGQGGPGYTIEDEFNPALKHDKAGILSMAKTGMPHSGGSQFFITLEATPHLDGKHAVFGEVISGMEVVTSIEVGDTIESVTLSTE